MIRYSCSMSRKSRTAELSTMTDVSAVKIPRIELSMRWSIVSLLTLLILLSAGLIILVSYLGSRQSTQFLIDTLMEDKAYRFIDKASQFLSEARTLAGDARERTAKLNPITQRAQVEEELRSVYDHQPYFSNVYLIRNNRAFIAHHDAIPKTQKTDVLEEIEEKSGEPEKHTAPVRFEEKALKDIQNFPWTQKIYAEGKKLTPIHKTFSTGAPGLTYCSPESAARGILAGGVCIDITLGDLALFIASVKVGETGKAFLADKEMNILAAPQETRDSTIYSKGNSDKIELKNITQFENGEIQGAYTAMLKKLKKLQKNKKWLKTKKPFYFDFKISGNRYVGTFAPFPAYTGLDWQSGVIIPEDEFFYFVRRNTRIVMAASSVLILLAMVLGYIFSRRLARPLSELSHEMDKIQNFDLDSDKTIVSSITDVQNMVLSFYKMRQGLRSFRKFVPADIVRQLIAQEGDAHLQGEKRELTIHFSDIEGFTTVSESLTPEDLVVLLGEYLGEMSRIIGEEHGTVDKYIGDAVMAFWGAPQPLPDHAIYAARAALRCQARLIELEKKWESEGRPVFRARIGLNTGEIIVGTMGSAERLNYTVIGDAVNLASRLEGINKYYGTRIIVGDTTQKLIATQFVTRLLDFVAVKGKNEASRIFELVGEKGKVDATALEFIRTFESAIEEYRRLNWDKAESLFQAAARLKDDEASQLFLNRISEYRINPPAAGWSGEYVMTSK